MPLNIQFVKGAISCRWEAPVLRPYGDSTAENKDDWTSGRMNQAAKTLSPFDCSDTNMRSLVRCHLRWDLQKVPPDGARMRENPHGAG